MSRSVESGSSLRAMSQVVPASAEDLLFTDLTGSRRTLEDVIDEGLDEDYSARLPALRMLLTQGSASQQLHACVMLVSWGDLAGYDTLLRWARSPETLPWRSSVQSSHAAQPVSADRIFGVDDAFARLTVAVRTSCLLSADHPALRALQETAVKALLKRYPSEYFARGLGDLLSAQRGLCVACLPEMEDAVAACLAHLTDVPFDLRSQTAFLLAPLARHKDAEAASYSLQLLACCPPGHRAVRETAHALRMGAHAATLAVLEQLAGSGSETVRADALKAIEVRRQRAHANL